MRVNCVAHYYDNIFSTRVKITRARVTRVEIIIHADVLRNSVDRDPALIANDSDAIQVCKKQSLPTSNEAELPDAVTREFNSGQTGQ